MEEIAVCTVYLDGVKAGFDCSLGRGYKRFFEAQDVIAS